MKYFITHLIKTELPKEGYRKVFFYTTTKELSRKRQYLYGKGVKTFNHEDINNRVLSGKIIELPNSKILEEGYGLWVDSEGKIFYAKYNYDESVFESKKELFAPKEMTKPKQIFNNSFRHLKNKKSINRFVKVGSGA